MTHVVLPMMRYNPPSEEHCPTCCQMLKKVVFEHKNTVDIGFPTLIVFPCGVTISCIVPSLVQKSCPPCFITLDDKSYGSLMRW